MNEPKKPSDGGPAFPDPKRWVVDIDTGQPDVPMDDQAKQADIEEVLEP